MFPSCVRALVVNEKGFAHGFGALWRATGAAAGTRRGTSDLWALAFAKAFPNRSATGNAARIVIALAFAGAFAIHGGLTVAAFDGQSWSTDLSAMSAASQLRQRGGVSLRVARWRCWNDLRDGRLKARWRSITGTCQGEGCG